MSGCADLRSYSQKSSGSKRRRAQISRSSLHELRASDAEGASAARVPALYSSGLGRRGLNGVAKSKFEPDVARYADMFSAMGTEPRLRIMRLLLSAHPQGMIAGDVGAELDIPASTLSHHLDKLKNEDLVRVRREGTFLWYSANADALQELLGFLYAECCTRNKAIEPQAIVPLCK
jgi:ArsR family transcriptional regulator, arsenate/arsenite/antimonite-responsive transcriptional repressor